mgnify:CR=1 FL=1
MDDLVKGLRAGESAAFERLVREYGDRIFRFVRRLVGARHAEDVAQDVLIRVHRSVASYEPTGSFDSWLFTIANNLCIDHLRRNRPERREGSLDAEEGEPHVPDHREAGPMAALEDREIQEALRRAVAALPVDQRQVFLMREAGGLTFEAIASALGIPAGTAKTRMRSALSHLRCSLESFAPASLEERSSP